MWTTAPMHNKNPGLLTSASNSRATTRMDQEQNDHQPQQDCIDTCLYLPALRAAPSSPVHHHLVSQWTTSYLEIVCFHHSQNSCLQAMQTQVPGEVGR
ncbi:hypothetical protein E2C01_010765 [Portunus trituberculatus]|uniref:Uncharacterized protein n=1 Tax=Portunus trituberculatus TaxID=210409 RepID=A0A5B7D9R0_PORTR|nr:hypothetical protein [Portunus trituberculatus]